MLDGLIVKTNWADMLLSGIKTWEIRGGQTHKRGTIGIVKSGTGKVWGTVDLVDCISLHGSDAAELFSSNWDKHRVLSGAVNYKKPWAWVVENPVILSKPVPYLHKQGAVIWVKLPDLSVLDNKGV